MISGGDKLGNQADGFNVITGIDTKVDVIDSYHDVASIDSAANLVMRDILGNKSDTHSGTSITARGKRLDEHAHSISRCYPTLKAPVNVVAAGSAYVLGAPSIIVGTTQNIDNAAAGDQTPLVRIPLTGHGLVVGNWVRIAGTINYNGLYEVMAVPDANHFDITATYVVEVFAGGGAETIIDVIPEDFDIHEISVEGISANGVYELHLFSGADLIGQIRFVKNAAVDATVNVSFQTPLMSAESPVSARIASSSAGQDADITIHYHLY